MFVVRPPLHRLAASGIFHTGLKKLLRIQATENLGQRRAQTATRGSSYHRGAYISGDDGGQPRGLVFLLFCDYD
jgi:hypothetical protein